MIQQNVKTRVMFVPNILETTLIATDRLVQQNVETTIYADRQNLETMPT